MSSVLRTFPVTKNKMSVSAVQWIPGALSATLPLFAVNDTNSSAKVLYLRADDSNIYGVAGGNLTQVPTVVYNNASKPANKGRNYYSAPWCIANLPARDTGRRIQINAIDPSIYAYITALYSLIGTTSITLGEWQLENNGYVKVYQTLQGSGYTNVNGTVYFGGTTNSDTQVSGDPKLTIVRSPLITGDFTYNGTPITTLRMPYNTFCAVDTPIVISAVDTSHTYANSDENPRIYFTLLNNVALFNGPNYY
jgi:hypothetical protein